MMGCIIMTVFVLLFIGTIIFLRCYSEYKDRKWEEEHADMLEMESELVALADEQRAVKKKYHDEPEEEIDHLLNEMKYVPVEYHAEMEQEIRQLQLFRLEHMDEVKALAQKWLDLNKIYEEKYGEEG